ncbi:hypothetical protein F8M41_002176 [Gigaspora margarita]|uniref:Uncharacterized protein n=1 Tax=Gigaspora margarita TaxID=4874 RepID=A0A8H3XEP6_GIGMA|nr:hypothetical protein F8M41_002176 [Gigaspora margarita]
MTRCKSLFLQRLNILQLIVDIGCHLLQVYRQGCWEWDNGTVRVVEFHSIYHESTVSAIMEQLYEMTKLVKWTLDDIKSCGSTTKEAKNQVPFWKPQVSSGGYDGEKLPWPNLLPNRAHDVIAIKLNYTLGGAPTEMTNGIIVWAKEQILYEFGSINRRGDSIDIQRGQRVVLCFLLT